MKTQQKLTFPFNAWKKKKEIFESIHIVSHPWELCKVCDILLTGIDQPLERWQIRLDQQSAGPPQPLNELVLLHPLIDSS